ncbi:hypothetical protein EJ05DRAFT_45142 [Pseudovirgaria hyperparasitica]|uniref:Sin3-associated polypeptide Sap18 n=1 Tax=Pseudovirgaria hyperparasitica TaxID=470096 RepID=A0A6A6W2Q1_9PEZI|nr:uncharacterized protein EJ05DRAFT_45142 [Pseudovirgaria hyperparasitica]KAF2756835.1 hypothetical protein EJ05DRAFT_45142 [Pseudovirgaria hyperparasitica]
MAAPPSKVDRQTTTPFLLKLFYRTGAFHRNDEFSPQSHPINQHLQIYTWPNCTLKELSHLLVSALPNVLPSPAIGTRLAFRLVFPDTKNTSGPPRYMSKDLGSIVVNAEPDPQAKNAPMGDLGGDAEKTLQDARFVIGDYVCCAIFPPLANGDVAGPPPPQAPGYGGMGYGGRGGRPPPRENGFGRGRDFRPRDPDGLPSGEWRRGDIPPPAPAGYGGGGRRGNGRYENDREYRGGYGGGGYGRARGRGRGGY